MMDLKKLYAVLILLIVIYVGINVGSMVINLEPQQVEDNATENMVTVGASSFPEIKNFKSETINDTALSLTDSDKNVTITISEIDNSRSIEDIFNDFVASSEASSTQTIDQNGTTAYFAYYQGAETYGTNVFFNKNGQNYMISGNNIDYNSSDYFINNCKNIIDTIEIHSIS